jgi:hypothetical protein
LLVVHQLFDGTSNLLQTPQDYFTPFWNILARHTKRYGSKHDFREAYIIVTRKNKNLHCNIFFPHKKFTLQNNITWLLVMATKRAFVLKHGPPTEKNKNKLMIMGLQWEAHQ